MEEYYIYINEDEKAGPYSLDELKDIDMYQDSLVKTDEMDDWVLAKNVPELKRMINKQTLTSALWIVVSFGVAFLIVYFSFTNIVSCSKKVLVIQELIM